MKTLIIANVKGDKIKDMVPTPYKEIAEMAEATIEGVITLLIFPHDRKNVIKENLARKAIEKIENSTSSKIVAVGGCFTQEAIKLLQECDAIILSLSDFEWTDQSYTDIRVGDRKLKK
jgi:hypothetical protein